MARPKPAPRKREDGGPWLQAALICQTLGVRENGSVDAMIGKVSVIELGPNQAGEGYQNLALVVSFVGGTRRGRFVIRIVWHEPGTTPREIFREDKVFDGPAFGHDVIAWFPATIHAFGTHWFDVYLDGDMVTKVPLRVGPIELPE